MDLRDTQIDTCKGILIFFVVLGHFLEEWVGWTSNELRAILGTIYTFHMPAFIFISGMFFKDKNILKKIIYFLCLLIPFHLAYVLATWFFKGNVSAGLIVIPCWILWYLAGMVAWYILTPLLKSTNYPVILSILLSVLIGFSPINNYYFSIGRVFVFLPFFVIGHLYGNNVLAYAKSHKFTLVLAPLVFVGLAIFYYNFEIHRAWLYGAWSYKQLDIDLLTGSLYRLIIFVSSLISIFSFLALSNLFVNKLEKLGKNTLSVYLLHGFVVLCLTNYIDLGNNINLVVLMSVLFTIITCIVLKQDIFERLIKNIANKLSMLIVKK